MHEGEEKVNAVNYLDKPQPTVDEYYYEEDTYAVNDQMGGFQQNSQGSNQDNWCQGKGNQCQNYGNYKEEGQYVRDGNLNRDKNFNWNNYGKKNEWGGLYVPTQNQEASPRNDGGSIGRVEDMLQKMMREF